MTLLARLRRFVRHISLVRDLRRYFDEEERQLVLNAIVVGVVVWAVVYGLRTAVTFLFRSLVAWVEGAPSPLLLFIPLLLGALGVTAVTRFRAALLTYRDEEEGVINVLNDAEGDGLERAIALYYTSVPSFEQALTGAEGLEVRWELPTFSLAIRKFLATLLTLGSGGSGGLGASAALIGESIAAGLFKPRPRGRAIANRAHLPGWLSRWWHTGTPESLQTAQLSGVAAAMAVVMGAPFAAAFFATEIMYRYRPTIDRLLYALLSSLIAFFLTDLVTEGHPTFFEVETLYVPPSDGRYYGVLVLLAASIALISLYFRKLRGILEDFFYRENGRPWRRHLLGAALTGMVAMGMWAATQSSGAPGRGLLLVLGPGDTAIRLAFAGELTLVVALLALAAKMLATLTTITSGGSAGLLFPTLYFGAMVALLFADLFGYEPMMIIIPAMTASLVSIANVPLAAILFVVEVFGSTYMVPGLLTLVVAFILSHESTIYRTQRDVAASRSIMPGVSVRRIRIPQSWHGRSLIDLGLRQRFDVTVIGLLEQTDRYGHPLVRLGASPTHPLRQDDVLVVLGADERLEQLTEAVRTLQEEEAES